MHTDGQPSSSPTGHALRKPPSSGYDAVIVGAGPNGLVAANVLADAGWRVIVLEEAQAPGGAVASAPYLGPGFVADVCSAFYPLAVASPAIAALRLEEHGLEWCRAPLVLANPLAGGDAAVLHADAEATAEALDARCSGDGDAWRRLVALFDAVAEPLLSSLCTPFPPVRSAALVLRALGGSGALRFARMSLLPVRRMGEEELAGEAGRLILAGCTAHTDLSPEAAGGALYGWLLAMLGQRVGFPVPRGGAGQLTAALVRRLEGRGGEIACEQRVVEIVVRAGRAVGVVTSEGKVVRAARAVLADVDAPTLYTDLVAREHLAAGTPDDARRFDWDRATVKVDWAITRPVPWTAEHVRRAGTVHIAHSVDELTRTHAELSMGEIPTRPFVLVGQPGVADPTRAPGEHQTVWAYAHVPVKVRADPYGVLRGTWDETELQIFADRLQARIEQHAPGFGALVVRRHVMGPRELAAHDRNLVHGAINGGTAGLHQQLVLRPLPGLGRPETPVRGLYLASSCAHPGGGVHGACGWNAARAALKEAGVGGRILSAVLVGAQRRLAQSASKTGSSTTSGGRIGSIDPSGSSARRRLQPGTPRPSG